MRNDRQDGWASLNSGLLLHRGDPAAAAGPAAAINEGYRKAISVDEILRLVFSVEMSSPRMAEAMIEAARQAANGN